MPIVAMSAGRVAANTDARVNERIRDRTLARLAYYRRRPGEVPGRLAQLDREWDVERVLETNAASLALAGTLLGVLVDRRFLAVPLAVSAFLLQHGLQGWCPPLPALRRLGVRTAREIEAERCVLLSILEESGQAEQAEARSVAAVSGVING